MRLRYFRGNIFVANLPPEFEDERLAEAFDGFGMVLSATIARDPETGKKLRYGFVDIATEPAAKAAVEAMNGQSLDGHKIEVRISERVTGAGKKPSGAAPQRRTTGRPSPTSRTNSPANEQRPYAGNGLYAGSPASPDGTAEPLYTVPRKPPQFQVEKRVLPRRLTASPARS